MTSPIYSLDTHALHWHLYARHKLSPAARNGIDEGEAGHASLVICHIVLAELFYLHQKLGQIGNFNTIMTELENHPSYRLESISVDDIRNLTHFPEIPEMHDRLIAIVAQRLGAVLITKDGSLQSSPQLKCLW